MHGGGILTFALGDNCDGIAPIADGLQFSEDELHRPPVMALMYQKPTQHMQLKGCNSKLKNATLSNALFSSKILK